MSAFCRSCRAEIVWAVTANAKRIPVDAIPVADGNVALADRGDSAPIATVNPNPDHPGERYVSHFATCPNADRHRKAGP